MYICQETIRSWVPLSLTKFHPYGNLKTGHIHVSLGSTVIGHPTPGSGPVRWHQPQPNLLVPEFRLPSLNWPKGGGARFIIEGSAKEATALRHFLCASVGSSDLRRPGQLRSQRRCPAQAAQSHRVLVTAAQPRGTGGRGPTPAPGRPQQVGCAAPAYPAGRRLRVARGGQAPGRGSS